jgi:hypothetical protein
MRMIKNRCKALSNLGRAFDEHIKVFWFESIYDEVMELLELEGVTAAWKEGVRTILLRLLTVLSSPRLARAVSACSPIPIYHHVESHHPGVKWPTKYRETAAACREYVNMLDDVWKVNRLCKHRLRKCQQSRRDAPFTPSCAKMGLGGSIMVSSSWSMTEPLPECGENRLPCSRPWIVGYRCDGLYRVETYGLVL